MANSRQYGVYGLLKKSVGSVVYSKGKDGAGKTIQIVRSKPTSVSNPRTVAQILQRAKIKPAQRFYNAIAEILDHSWQGIEYGTPSRNYFLSKALKQVGPYIPKSVSQMIPAAYPVSEGSIASIIASPDAPTASDANIVLQNVTLTATIVAALEAAGVPVGSQLTIIAFYRRQNGEYAKAFGRIINQEGAIFEWNGSTASNMAVTLVPSSSTFHISQANGLSTVAVAAIVSMQVNGSWQRSTQSLVLTQTMEDGLYGDSAMQLTIESYGDVEDINKLNSAWYLNLANGQAWPGRILTVMAALSDGGERQQVVVGEQVSASGALKYFVFTDSGAAAGNVIIIGDAGVPAASQIPATFVVSENGRLYGYTPELWLNVYATQMGF